MSQDKRDPTIETFFTVSRCAECDVRRAEPGRWILLPHDKTPVPSVVLVLGDGGQVAGCVSEPFVWWVQPAVTVTA
jgi:hypothetical protein